ncbi:MAG: response regulator [Desulfobacterales bacterium]|nr:response regulator [Desulfobacterales bacterium]
MAKASEKYILVVDDEPDVRNFLAAFLEDAGFQVDVAVDGVEALEKVKEKTPDLMTLDMVMPRKSGIRVMRELRNREDWSKIPVIVITAHARDEFGSDDIKEFNAFATRYRPRYTMEKPVTPEKLVKAIMEILEVDEEETKDNIPVSRDSILKMVQESDPSTLKKIQDLLQTA